MPRSLLLAIAMASTASAQPQPNAQTVLANVQKYYATPKQMTAQFRQEVTYATFGQTQKSDGTLYVEKPSNLRWDYMLKTSAGVKPDKTFVLNASTMWLVDHKNKKIIQSAVQGTVLPAAISFLTGSGNLATEFNVVVNTSGKYGKPGMTVLELTPKRPSAQYKQLFFVVDPTDSHISESIVIDANGNTNDFHFYAPDLQAPIRAGWFQVNPANLPNYLVVKPTAPTAAPTTAKPAAKP